MTWDEFNSAVRIYLVAHNRRQGIQSLIAALIKAGVWDLQAAVPYFRPTVKRTFAPNTLRAYGYTATGRLAAGCKVMSVYAYETTDKYEKAHFRITQNQDEFELMQAGDVQSRERIFYYNTDTGAFYITPSPKDDGSNLVVEFAATKIDYDDGDDVPLEEKAAEAVGYFVLTRLALQVDRDPQSAQMFGTMHTQTKRKLRSEFNPAAQVIPREPIATGTDLQVSRAITDASGNAIVDEFGNAITDT